MDRRLFVRSIIGGMVAVPLACFAQAQGNVWRIGMLETTSAALNSVNLAALRDALRELGYVEGRNLVIEYRSSDGRNERFADLATELIALKVDLIVARSTAAAISAKNATTTIPVVMTATGEPLLVVASLAHPGGNVTGLSSVTVDIESKRVALLRELLPRAVRVAALYNLSSPTNPAQWRQVETAARSSGIQPLLLDVRKAEDLEPAFAAATRQRADGLIVGQDGLFQANRKLIAELAIKHRLPAIYRSMESIEAGGLMAYGPSYPDLYRNAAGYVAKIFQGAKPGDLPIEQPKKFELIINLNAAKTINLMIPQSLLLRADEVIR